MNDEYIHHVIRSSMPGDWVSENRYEFDNTYRPTGFFSPQRVEYGPNRRLSIVMYSEKECSYKAEWLHAFRNTLGAAHVYVRVLYDDALIEERHGFRVDGRRCLVPVAHQHAEGRYYFVDDDRRFFDLLNRIETRDMPNGSSWATCLEDAAKSSYFLQPDMSSGPKLRGDA